MEELFVIEDGPIPLKIVMDYTFSRKSFKTISVSHSLKNKIENSYSHLIKILDNKIPVYGVTTGFGDSCQKAVNLEESKNLQENLLSYLRCGTGHFLDYYTSKATLLLRIPRILNCNFRPFLSTEMCSPPVTNLAGLAFPPSTFTLPDRHA